MKKILLSLMILSSLTLFLAAGDSGQEKQIKLPAQGEDWVAGPGPEWELNYDAALERAGKEHKYIYVLSTGSDWCGWCIKLRNDVLTNSKFKRFAEENLVLLYLDSPSKIKLPAKQDKHNSLVREMYDMDDGFPSAVVLDEDGDIVARRSGYGNLDSYMAFLKKAVKTSAEDYEAELKKRKKR